MNRVLIFILTAVCVLGLSSQSRKDSVPETSDFVSIPVQSMETGNPNEGKSWTEQDVTLMFSRVRETDWEYIDCVLMPDHASDRIGAVLFWNDKEKTSSVAFFNADGFYHQCGTYARLSEKPDFTYLGDGAVTFKLESDDGTIYHFTITISIEGSNVNFKTEDDLPKQ